MANSEHTSTHPSYQNKQQWPACRDHPQINAKTSSIHSLQSPILSRFYHVRCHIQSNHSSSMHLLSEMFAVCKHGHWTKQQEKKRKKKPSVPSNMILGIQWNLINRETLVHSEYFRISESPCWDFQIIGSMSFHCKHILHSPPPPPHPQLKTITLNHNRHDPFSSDFPGLTSFPFQLEFEMPNDTLILRSG